MEDILVPIALFVSSALVLWSFGNFNFKKRLTIHETIRHAIDGGQQVSMELVEKMSLVVDPVRADLRRGVLFIAFGIAILVLGLILTSQEGEPAGPIIGVALFPVILGVAYLGLWKFAHKRSA